MLYNIFSSQNENEKSLQISVFFKTNSIIIKTSFKEAQSA